MNPLLINLLLALGGSLGASLVKSPQLQAVIATAITGAENLVNILTGKSGAQIAAPAFLAVLQAAIGVLEAEGKLTTGQATALNDAIAATLQADAQSQVTVDPSKLATPILPLS